MIANRLPQLPGEPIPKGQVDGGFGGVISGSYRIQVVHAGGNVVERKGLRLDSLQKCEHGVSGFSVTAARRCFAQSTAAIVPVELEKDDGIKMGAPCRGVAGNGPLVRQLQIEPPEF